MFVPASAAANGIVTGRVLDGMTGNPLPGASISVDGTSLSAQSDRTGAFTLLRVPHGKQTVSVAYLGFETSNIDVEVSNGGRVSIDVQMHAAISEVVTVEAPLLEGQARALNLQKESNTIQNIVSADQIGRFPDPNSAEAAQRIPRNYDRTRPGRRPLRSGSRHRSSS